MNEKIPLFEIFWEEDDVEAVASVIRRGSYWAVGPEIPLFEERLADYVGTDHAIVFNSGTSALHAVLLASEIGQGDEVIVPSFSFISTANAPLFVGAKPIFADIEEKSLGLDPEDVQKRITDSTKAIMPIHYAGSPCMIRELKEIADDEGVLLIEDAAESLGATIDGRRVGTFGDSSILSFCQNKIISTGEGGAVVTNSKKLHDRLKLVRSHGRQEYTDYFESSSGFEYLQVGYNFRMPSMCAALGIRQMEKIDWIINERRKVASFYESELSRIEHIELLEPISGYERVHQLYPILVKGGIRDELEKYLREMGIFTKVYFPPIHLSTFYRNRFHLDEGDLPVTERISGEVLSLPIYPSLEPLKLSLITDNIIRFCEGYN